MLYYYDANAHACPYWSLILLLYLLLVHLIFMATAMYSALNIQVGGDNIVVIRTPINVVDSG